MRKKINKWFYFFIVFFLTSCIEIIDDLKINQNGSGTFKYTINLSSSKTKVGTFLSLDSLDGKKVLKTPEIKQKINLIRIKLKEQEGITNVLITEDYVNYIIKLQLDFNNVENLELALKETVKTFYQNGDYNYDWINYNNNVLCRNIPAFYGDYIKNYTFKEVDKLKEGSYFSITRFSNKIGKVENNKSVISKSGMATMIKTTPDSVIYNPKLLTNKITLNKK